MKNITSIIFEMLKTHGGQEPAVTIVGDLNYDYIYTCPALESGKEVFISSFSREIAGAGGYVACGLARLGASVEILTELGGDADGRALYEELGLRGIRRGGTRLLEGKRSPTRKRTSSSSMPRKRAFSPVCTTPCRLLVQFVRKALPLSSSAGPRASF